MPFWLYFLLLAPTSLLAVRDVLADKTFWHQPHFYFMATVIIALWISTSILFTYKTMVQQSFVVFQRVHDTRGFQKKWTEWRPYIIAAIVGGVVKELFDIIKKAFGR